MELEQLVKAAVEFFCEQPATASENLTETRDAFVAVLEGEGVDRARAEAVFLFVPLAFSRQVLQSEDFKIDFPQYYIEAYSSSSKETKRRLGKSPLFRIAVRTASRCTCEEDARKIASFSTEYQAIRNVNSIAEANDIELIASSVTAPDLYHVVPSERPWWKLWW